MTPVQPSEVRSSMSGADAPRLLEITHACISCTTRSDFADLIPKLRQLVPFDHMVAASARLGPDGGVLPGRSVNVSYPDEFCREYLARDYLRVDPVVRDALTTSRAQYCSETMPARPKEITALCSDFGLREGYAVASTLAVPGGGGTLFVFKGPSMRVERRLAETLEFLAPHLHLACSRALEGEEAAANHVVLSGRETEVLAWLQQGKSSWEVSVILAISERTVNFHVANLKRKLGATNRAQALAIAARLGLLSRE